MKHREPGRELAEQRGWLSRKWLMSYQRYGLKTKLELRLELTSMTKSAQVEL